MFLNQPDKLKRRDAAFTLIEALIAISISTLILLFAYRVFFSQTEMVTKSLEFMQVNDSLRKVLSFMGDDIRESTTILKPTPIMLKPKTNGSDDAASFDTRPGVILHLQGSEIDPQIPFNSPLGGQVALRRQIIYELEKIPETESQTIPRYRLIRTASIEEKPGQKSTQRQVLVDNIRDMAIYRTVRKPFKPANISSSKDHLVLPLPLSQSGTGNSLVHLKMLIERSRKDTETGQVYSIAMNTSFYKRGKEIFIHP